MRINEAYKILEITPHSSEKEIKQSYRRLSKFYHPDQNSGNPKKQIQLNEANKVIQAYKKISNSVIPIESNENLIAQMENNLMRFELREEISRHSKKIYRKKANKINILKYAIWFITSFTAILTFFHKDILPTIESLEEYKRALIIVLILFGGLALLLQILLQRIKINLEIYTDRISEKKECAIELAEILSYKSVKIFTKEELFKSSLFQPLTPVSFFKVEKYDLIDLLILKAKEHNLISEKDKELTSIDSFDEYEINYNPELFRRINETKTEKPATIDEVKSKMIFSLIGSIFFFTVSILIFFLIKTNWKFISIGSIINSIGLLGIFLEERKEYKKIKNKAKKKGGGERF